MRLDFFLAIAVVLFAVGGVLVLTDDTPDMKLLWGLLFFGSVAFAAGHVPWFDNK